MDVWICKGGLALGRPAHAGRIFPVALKKFIVKEMRARVTPVDNCFKSLFFKMFFLCAVGDSTMGAWVIAHINPQILWVIAHTNSQNAHRISMCCG